MTRKLLFACLLLGSAEVKAQPDARVYYNRYEWVGLAGGYTVNRWRYEVNASYHQKEYIGLYAESYQTSPQGNVVLVFNDDVWGKHTTTIAGRVVRTGKKLRPRFGLYYGLYLRYQGEPAKLTEAHWDSTEEEVEDKFGAPTSSHQNDFCFGFLLGARGTIVKNVFWDANLALFPLRYTFYSVNYSDGFTSSTKDFSYTYFEGDYRGHVLQVGIGYKFGMPKTE